MKPLFSIVKDVSLHSAWRMTNLYMLQRRGLLRGVFLIEAMAYMTETTSAVALATQEFSGIVWQDETSRSPLSAALFLLFLAAKTTGFICSLTKLPTGSNTDAQRKYRQNHNTLHPTKAVLSLLPLMAIGYFFTYKQMITASFLVTAINSITDVVLAYKLKQPLSSATNNERDILIGAATSSPPVPHAAAVEGGRTRPRTTGTLRKNLVAKRERMLAHTQTGAELTERDENLASVSASEVVAARPEEVAARPEEADDVPSVEPAPNPHSNIDILIKAAGIPPITTNTGWTALIPRVSGNEREEVVCFRVLQTGSQYQPILQYFTLDFRGISSVVIPQALETAFVDFETRFQINRTRTSDEDVRSILQTLRGNSAYQAVFARQAQIEQQQAYQHLQRPRQR